MPLQGCKGLSGLAMPLQGCKGLAMPLQGCKGLVWLEPIDSLLQLSHTCIQLMLTQEMLTGRGSSAESARASQD